MRCPTTCKTLSAPFFTEMQASWQAYAPADAALSRALRRIVESFPT